jgi:hypothetical protein
MEAGIETGSRARAEERQKNCMRVGSKQGKATSLFTAFSQPHLLLGLKVIVAGQVLAQCPEHDHSEQARQKEDNHEAGFARGRGVRERANKLRLFGG